MSEYRVIFADGAFLQVVTTSGLDDALERASTYSSVGTPDVSVLVVEILPDGSVVPVEGRRVNRIGLHERARYTSSTGWELAQYP